MTIEEKVCVKQWYELKVISKRHRTNQVSLFPKFDNTGMLKSQFRVSN